jgi:hypothetical protein
MATALVSHCDLGGYGHIQPYITILHPPCTNKLCAAPHYDQYEIFGLDQDSRDLATNQYEISGRMFVCIDSLGEARLTL